MSHMSIEKCMMLKSLFLWYHIPWISLQKWKNFMKTGALCTNVTSSKKARVESRSLSCQRSHWLLKENEKAFVKKGHRTWLTYCTSPLYRPKIWWQWRCKRIFCKGSKFDEPSVSNHRINIFHYQMCKSRICT